MGEGGDVDAGEEIAQERADRFEIDDDVDGGGRQRARELRELGSLGFWTTTVPPGLFDAAGAFGAVEGEMRSG